MYDFIRHRTEPRTYVVYARFKSQAAFDAHMKAPSTTAWCRRSWRASPRTWTCSSSTGSPERQRALRNTSSTLPGMWKYSP